MDGLTAHRSALKDRHATLEKEISFEVQRPWPDTLRLVELKKQKLRIKQELAAAE